MYKCMACGPKRKQRFFLFNQSKKVAAKLDGKQQCNARIYLELQCARMPKALINRSNSYLPNGEHSSKGTCVKEASYAAAD